MGDEPASIDDDDVVGEVFDLGEHLDRATNSVSAVVERTYVIGWDTALVEITVTPA